eukprot:TRINITY_DN35570_c0_g1_i1.p1 TRINITY_DN35570_c0_g1~~TRINITY_DN35570_c0_g1_i1.p1  ORF type:complete len:649 (+),score=128.56 TRINITY_DN35570_c0_g1_i1:95-1948(+)
MASAQPDGATPVILIQSVPADATRERVQEWASQLTTYRPRTREGDPVSDEKVPTRCVDVLITQNRSRARQAFLQFENIWAARSFMETYVYQPRKVALDGVPLNIVYSRRQHITRPEGGARQGSDAACGGYSAPEAAHGSAAEPPSRLLLVVFRNLPGDFGLNDVFCIFSQFGHVEKISTFAKDDKSQAIVQFQDASCAGVAMGYLDGKEVQNRATEEPCTLAIVRSKLRELTFRNEDRKNADFVTTNERLAKVLPGVDTLAALQQKWTHEFGPLQCPNLLDFVWGNPVFGQWLVPRQAAKDQGTIPASSKPLGEVGHCLHVADHGDLDAHHLFRLCGSFADIVAVKLLYKQKGCALVQFRDNAGRDKAKHLLNGLRFQGREITAKDSTQPNATHWSGSSRTLQQRMCSVLDRDCRQPPVEADITVVTGDTVTFWAWEAERDVASLIFAVTKIAPVSKYVEHDGRVTMKLPDEDAAVKVIANLNGTQCGLWRSGAYQVRFATETERRSVEYPDLVDEQPPQPQPAPAADAHSDSGSGPDQATDFPGLPALSPPAETDQVSAKRPRTIMAGEDLQWIPPEQPQDPPCASYDDELEGGGFGVSDLVVPTRKFERARPGTL